MKLKFILVSILLVSLTSFANIPQAEKQALIDLYQSTQGDLWNTSWNLDAAPTTWEGVIIKNDRVVSLKLVNNNLVGQLPESLGNLSALTVLNLHNNKIEGTIPTNILRIDNLKILNLSLNQLSGTIPDVSTDRKSVV